MYLAMGNVTVLMTTIIKYIYEVFNFCQHIVRMLKEHVILLQNSSGRQLQLNFWRYLFPTRILSTVMRISEFALLIWKYPATLCQCTLWFSSLNREMSLIFQDFKQGHICRGSLSYPCFGELIKTEAVKRKFSKAFIYKATLVSKR